MATLTDGEFKHRVVLFQYFNSWDHPDSYYDWSDEQLALVTKRYEADKAKRLAANGSPMFAHRIGYELDGYYLGCSDHSHDDGCRCRCLLRGPGGGDQAVNLGLEEAGSEL